MPVVGIELSSPLTPFQAGAKGSWMTPYAFKDTKTTKRIQIDVRKIPERYLGILFPPNSALLNNCNCLLRKITLIPKIIQIELIILQRQK